MDRINELDQLFEAARTAPPKISFDQTKAVFIASAGAGSLLSLLFTIKKLPLMLVTASVITSTVIAVSMGIAKPEPPKKLTTTVIEVQEPVQTITPENSAPLDDEWVATSSTHQLENVTMELKEAWLPPILPITISLDSLSPVKPKALIESAIRSRFNIKELDVKRIFHITNETSPGEMEEIDSLATRAGIEFSYEVKRNKKLKSLKLKLHTDSVRQTTSLSFDGTFDVVVGWIEDENGKAIKLYSPPVEMDLNNLQLRIDETMSVFDERMKELDISMFNTDILQLKLDSLHLDLDLKLDRLFQQFESVEEEEENNESIEEEENNK